MASSLALDQAAVIGESAGTLKVMLNLKGGDENKV